MSAGPVQLKQSSNQTKLRRSGISRSAKAFLWISSILLVGLGFTLLFLLKDIKDCNHSKEDNTEIPASRAPKKDAGDALRELRRMQEQFGISQSEESPQTQSDELLPPPKDLADFFNRLKDLPQPKIEEIKDINGIQMLIHRCEGVKAAKVFYQGRFLGYLENVSGQLDYLSTRLRFGVEDLNGNLTGFRSCFGFMSRNAYFFKLSGTSTGFEQDGMQKTGLEDGQEYIYAPNGFTSLGRYNQETDKYISINKDGTTGEVVGRLNRAYSYLPLAGEDPCKGEPKMYNYLKFAPYYANEAKQGDPILIEPFKNLVENTAKEQGLVEE